MDVEEKSSLFSLSIDDTTQSHLLSIAKWHKFIAITGMVAFVIGICAIIISSFLYLGPSLNHTYDVAEQVGIVLSYIIFIAVFFIPCIFQLKFANKMMKGLAGNDQFLINQSLRQLKIFSRYWGILIIVCVGLVIFGFFLGFMGI